MEGVPHKSWRQGLPLDCVVALLFEGKQTNSKAISLYWYAIDLSKAAKGKRRHCLRLS